MLYALSAQPHKRVRRRRWPLTTARPPCRRGRWLARWSRCAQPLGEKAHPRRSSLLRRGSKNGAGQAHEHSPDGLRWRFTARHSVTGCDASPFPLFPPMAISLVAHARPSWAVSCLTRALNSSICSRSWRSVSWRSLSSLRVWAEKMQANVRWEMIAALDFVVTSILSSSPPYSSPTLPDATTRRRDTRFGRWGRETSLKIRPARPNPDLPPPPTHPRPSSLPLLFPPFLSPPPPSPPPPFPLGAQCGNSHSGTRGTSGEGVRNRYLLLELGLLDVELGTTLSIHLAVLVGLLRVPGGVGARWTHVGKRKFEQQ